MRTVIVYVHGLWLPGGEAFLLRRRLAGALGAECRVFSYPSVSANITENAHALGKYLQKISAETLHLVAHSMGGLVVLRLFELGAALGLRFAPGRIVLTGSPVRGSRTAQRLARLPFGKAILGLAAAESLLVPCVPRWTAERELGVISGDMGIGLGRLLGPFHEPNDGTVLAAETELPGAVDQIRLHVSHTGMVFSAVVARQIAAFLAVGRFDRTAQPS